MLNNELILIKPTRHKDERGFFSEVYSQRRYRELGVDVDFPQENHSFSWEVGTLRGLHFQAPPNAQGKLVRCGKGAIFDVAVDIRKGSQTFGHWKGYELTEENGHQLYVPVGFAHGFLTLKPGSEIVYKCTNYYAPKAEGSIRWDDPSIGIEWPLSENIILNKRDTIAPLLKDFKTPFTFGENT
jgi:dTDP-4-dehydrorhamnose 3,5-epimerase